MKRYPTYKDSGVEWIGSIPEHWDKKKLKHAGKIVLGKMLTPEDKGGYFKKPYLRAQNILWEKVDINDVKKMWFSQKEIEQYRLRFNDLLVSEGGEVGRTAIWKSELEECYIQNSVHKITFNGLINPSYFLYLLTTFGKRGHFDAIVNKVSIGHLTKEKLQEIQVFSPSNREQISIADYLDNKTHLIDTLIEKKQKQIELLQEQRAVIINQAVTKGLNPNVPMKESGIEWLGKIPEHWDIKKLKYLFQFVSGGTPSTEALNYWDGDIPWVSPKDMKNGYITDTIDHVNFSAIENNKTPLIPEKSALIVVRSGILRHKIPVAIAMKELTINQDIKGVVPKIFELDTEFFTLFILGFQSELLTAWRKQGATVESLELELIINTKFPLPPAEEQKQIINFIKKKINEIESFVDKCRMQIEKYKEYRTTLISEVVTGKIDVRDEAIP